MKRSLIVMLALAVLIGCGEQAAQPGAQGGEAKPGAQPGAQAGAQQAAAQQAGGETAKGGMRIAVIPKGLSHQFWLTVKAGADAAGKEFGAEIIWQGPSKETEIEKQISIMEDMITSKVNAIVMAACDENALINVIQQAIDAGIPVVTIDSGVKSELPVSFVATDNVAGAKEAARTLAKLIGEEGEVGLIPFVKGAATSEMREQGFIEGIAEFPNIKIVGTLYSDSDSAKGMSVTEDMMTSNANLKGIFAASEPTAVGCASAIRSGGKAGQVKMVGFDASEQQITDLKDGVCQALVVQNPYRMGYEGVKAAMDHLAGKAVEKRIDTGVTVVTMENFDTPEVQKLLYPLK